jgi:flagellar biosynthesis/type III secretory pathway M-ring protein FliF/YscJ
MDPEIAELTELTRRSIALAEDNNRVLHKMRRSIWWGRIWVVVWWVLIFIVSGAAYYYYAAPYLQKAEALYSQVQQDGAQAQSWEQQLKNFFSNPLGASQAPAAPQAPAQ